MNFDQDINEYLNRLKDSLDRISLKEISVVLSLFLAAYEKGVKIFVCGNGGSASTASHLACDFNKGLSYGRSKRFKVISLSDNVPTMMAYSNDQNYDAIFIEQLKNFMSPGDVVIGISGSGNSSNVLRAVEYANERGNVTIGITGFDGGKLKAISSYSINTYVDNMQISEDIHLILNHLMMTALNKQLGV